MNGAASAVLIDQVRLTTYLGSDDVLQHHFAFQAANWSRGTLSVLLPPGARPVAAQADGEILPALVIREKPEAGRVLELPVPERTGIGDGWHRFEVVYVTDAPAWLVWSQVEAPAPRVLIEEKEGKWKPVEPIRFRRSWRLPPGVVPLFDASLRRLPGPGENEAPPRHEPRPADLFTLGPSAADLLSRGEWPGVGLDPDKQQALADACLGFRSGRSDQLVPLGEVIARVADECLKKAQLAIIVDTVALREARLAPQTLLTVAPLASGEDQDQPWKPLGLVTVSTHSTVVLTTHRQAELWDALGEQVHSLPDDLEQAITVAIRQGHDPSGRFVVAPAWLRHEAEVTAAFPASAFLEDDDGTAPWSLLSPGLTLGHWTEWEPIGGAPSPARLLLVRREMVTTLRLRVYRVGASGLLARGPPLDDIPVLVRWTVADRRRCGPVSAAGGAERAGVVAVPCGLCRHARLLRRRPVPGRFPPA